MSVAYVGASDFTLQKLSRGEPHFGLKTRWLEYRGAGHKLAAFLATLPTGGQLEGGYIVNRDIDEGQGPYDSLRVQVALPPDFNAYLASNSVGVKSASKSATVNSAPVYRQVAGEAASGEPDVECTKEVTYYSPETSYRYFASAKPGGARYNTLQISSACRAIRSRITAQAGGRTVVFGGNAPAAVVAAISMATEVKVTSHSSEPIPGTPWYECADVVAAELAGDS